MLDYPGGDQNNCYTCSKACVQFLHVNELGCPFSDALTQTCCKSTSTTLKHDWASNRLVIPIITKYTSNQVGGNGFIVKYLQLASDNWDHKQCILLCSLLWR